jgi:D-tyrosyl-tRNA(Tyr) deacylase
MKIVVQHVKQATVEVESQVVGSISAGLVLLVGVEVNDSFVDADLLIEKIVNLRTFFNPDLNKYFDLSLIDCQADTLIVSQFTLPATFKKGKRPEFSAAMPPVEAKQLYEYFVDSYRTKVGKLNVQTGVFGANMQISLINDGPITYILNSNDFK